MAEATSHHGNDGTNRDELVELAVHFLEGQLNDSDRQRFNALLAGDAGNREAFGDICTHAYLLASRVAFDACEDAATLDEAPECPVSRAPRFAGLPGGGWNAAIDYLAGSRSLMYVAYLFAAVLCGLGLLAGLWLPLTTPSPVARRISPPAGAAPQAAIVAKIVRSVGCDWADPEVGREGTGIPLDSCFFVPSGRLEIRYNIGVKVVIQGPAMFAVDAPNGGVLRLGNVLVQVESGKPDARDELRKKGLGAVRPGPTLRPGLPAEPADNPPFCIRYSNDATCHCIMSDRGAEFALSFTLSKDTSGLLTAYILKGPVWVPKSEHVLSTTAFLQAGSSLTAGIDKNGASRVAIGQERPPPALLRGLLDGRPPATDGNREQRRGS